jgi:hypothetical protein
MGRRGKVPDSLSLNLREAGVNVSGCLLSRFNEGFSDQERGQKRRAAGATTAQVVLEEEPLY